MVEYLSFVPVVIMSALWFDNLFVQHLGSLPTINVENLLASIPTVLAAVVSKSLMVVVVVGIISLAVVRCLAECLTICWLVVKICRCIKL